MGHAKQKRRLRSAYRGPTWCWRCSRWMGKVEATRWEVQLRCPKCGEEKTITPAAYEAAQEK